MEKELLSLFNAVQVPERKNNDFDVDILKKTIRNGYVLDPSIFPSVAQLKIIENIVGISGEKANSAFHKSWAIIRDSSIEDLVLQQIVHYITTYGFEAMGIGYHEEFVYVPHENLDLPEITNDIPLVFIRAMTKEDVYKEIIALSSGIALAKDTLENILTIIKFNQYSSDIVEIIKNRELKSSLYEYFDIVPSEPMEYLRFVIKKLTNESLIIKNNFLIKKIKEEGSRSVLDKLILQAPDNLASIFFRFKPLFLAMKSISRNKTFFNQLRKKANVMHKALPVDYMNNVTSQIKNRQLSFDELDDHLKDAGIFRKIRLAYALNYRLQNVDSIVYKVRNGRGWVDNFSWTGGKTETSMVLNRVLDSISQNISKNVNKKVIYIPDSINYALPATEKQFSGFIPSNSYVVIPESIIVGIHWTNVNYNRIDLDFSLTSTEKYGWDARYRSSNSNILFSGDLTSAPQPNGASELYYIEKIDSPLMLKINYFNFDPGKPVPCKLFVTSENSDILNKKYVVDINKIIASNNIVITEKETIFGLLTQINGENRLYFSSTSTGNSISSKVDNLTEKSRKYMIASSLTPIDFKSVLVKSGAIIVNEKPETGEFINLSPEFLNKNSIISLLQ